MIINSHRFQNVYFQGTFSLPLPSSRLRFANKLFATKFLRSRLHRHGTIVSSVKQTLSINAIDSIFFYISCFGNVILIHLLHTKFFCVNYPPTRHHSFFFVIT